MTQSLVTVAIPFAAGKLEDVNAYLDSLGNPARELRGALDGTELVHFMSITAVPADGEQTAHLIIELSVDGTPAQALERVSDAIAPRLKTLLGEVGISLNGTPLFNFLYDRRLELGQGWFHTPGLEYNGTPGMSVARIKQEAALAKRISALLDDTVRCGSALATLQQVRAALWADDGAKWAFVSEPEPCLRPMPSTWAGIAPALVSATTNVFWPFLVIAILPLIAFESIAAIWRSPQFAATGFGLGLWAAALLAAAEVIVAGMAYYWFRAREQSDTAENVAPDKEHVDQIMKRESHSFQNHLAAVSRMKPGALRRFTLRIGLWAAGLIAIHFSRPSFLGPTGVIHFARWILLPGTDKLLFFSNYDGAWESPRKFYTGSEFWRDRHLEQHEGISKDVEFILRRCSGR
jgi:hypothetical protein